MRKGAYRCDMALVACLPVLCVGCAWLVACVVLIRGGQSPTPPPEAGLDTRENGILPPAVAQRGPSGGVG